ncbi:response regulator transcription factor [Herbaspirillum huttiense]|uniref:response regulator transcription factor n=1 Tax=Herbaspirillum huttiense TaxID=863372 RepID=UPI001AC35935|nr:response regulator transcription factor [Herbaspirillum huttiense]MBN9356563.1 response regulator transcription factor [Herbaspirillum huttiense]
MTNNAGPAIAYLEDDPEVAKLYAGWMRDAGYPVECFVDGEEYLKAFSQKKYLACVVDYIMPSLNGLEVLKKLRSQLGINMPPLIFLTGQDSEKDVVEILNQGADDYLFKSCSRELLLARLRAVLRRYDLLPKNRSLSFGDLKIDLVGRKFLMGQEAVQLTDKESELAYCLFQNIGSIVTRDYLLKVVWELNPAVTTRTIDTHISTLRRKLGLFPENGWRLTSVYGKGYRLEEQKKQSGQDT